MKLPPLTAHQRAVRARIHRQLFGESGYHRIARLARPWRWYASDLPALVLVAAALFILLSLLTGCADMRALEPADGAEQAPTAELEREGEGEDAPAAELEPSDAPPIDVRAPIDYLALEGVACTGHWVESDDVGTRLQAHPDTGRCTLPCQIVGPQRNTCTPEHAAHLRALCAELGGTCTLARDGLSYCETVDP